MLVMFVWQTEEVNIGTFCCFICHGSFTIQSRTTVHGENYKCLRSIYILVLAAFNCFSWKFVGICFWSRVMHYDFLKWMSGKNQHKGTPWGNTNYHPKLKEKSSETFSGDIFFTSSCTIPSWFPNFMEWHQDDFYNT